MNPLLLAMIAAAFGPAPVSQDEPRGGGPTLADRVRIPSNVAFVTSISGDGKVLSILFENLFIELESARSGSRNTSGQTAASSKVVTLRIPYEAEDDKVPMRADIRGFLGADAGVTAHLIAIAGDAADFVDLSADNDVELNGDLKGLMEERYPESRFDDYFDRVEFTAIPRAESPVIQLTFMLHAEHDTDRDGGGGALLQVDSVDLAIASPEGSSQYKSSSPVRDR